MGIAPASEDLPWIRAVDHAVRLGSLETDSEHGDAVDSDGPAESLAPENASGPAGWNTSILNIIS